MSSGDKCPKCGKGKMKVRTSRQKGTIQIQTLQCDCGHKEEAAIPADRVWRRER